MITAIILTSLSLAIPVAVVSALHNERQQRENHIERMESARLDYSRAATALQDAQAELKANREITEKWLVLLEKCQNDKNSWGIAVHERLLANCADIRVTLLRKVKSAYDLMCKRRATLKTYTG